MNEFAITPQSNVRRFNNELHEQVENDLHDLGPDTLATVIYMLIAIAEGSTIECSHAEDGEFLTVIDNMHSAELWKTFITLA